MIITRITYYTVFPNSDYAVRLAETLFTVLQVVTG